MTTQTTVNLRSQNLSALSMWQSTHEDSPIHGNHMDADDLAAPLSDGWLRIIAPKLDIPVNGQIGGSPWQVAYEARSILINVVNRNQITIERIDNPEGAPAIPINEQFVSAGEADSILRQVLYLPFEASHKEQESTDTSKMHSLLWEPVSGHSSWVVGQWEHVFGNNLKGALFVQSLEVETSIALPDEIERALRGFALGIEGAFPDREALRVARQLAVASVGTVMPEVTVDIDGALSFDLRLSNGNLLLAEIGTSGELDASLYDAQDNLIRRMRKASADELVKLISAS